MKWRNTLIALALLILIGAYIHWVEKKDAAKEELAAKKQIAIDIDWQQLQKLRFENAKGNILFSRLKQKDEQGQYLYSIDEPVSAKTDKFSVRNVVKAVQDLKIQRTIDEQPKNLSQFGLDIPALTLTVFYGENEKEPAQRVLKIGGKNPGNDGMYAQLDDQAKVYLVDKGLEFQTDRSLFNFRDKLIFALKSDKINYLKLEFPQQKRQTLELSKKEGHWFIDGPLKSPANNEKVAGLVSSWALLRASSFPTEQADQQLLKYGLDKPEVILTFGSAKSKEQPQLLIGKLLENNEGKDKKQLFARLAKRNTVFGLRSDLISDLSKDFAELVVKKFFDISSASLQQLALKTDELDILLRKNRVNAWHLTKPVSDLAAQSQVEHFIDQLNELKADEYLGKKLKIAVKDKLTLSLTSTVKSKVQDDKKVPAKKEQTTTVEFFEDDENFVARHPVNKLFYRIPAKKLEKLQEQAQDLRDKRLVRMPAPSIKLLELVQDGKKKKLMPSAADVQPLLQLEAASFADNKDAAWKKEKGLKPASLYLNLLSDEKNAKQIQIPFGLEQEDGRWALNEKGVAVLLDKKEIAEALAKVGLEQKEDQEGQDDQ